MHERTIDYFFNILLIITHKKKHFYMMINYYQ